MISAVLGIHLHYSPNPQHCFKCRAAAGKELVHEDTGERCNYTSWLNRGWCRAELWYRTLSNRLDTSVIVTWIQKAIPFIPRYLSGWGLELRLEMFASQTMLGYDSYYPTSSKACCTECVTPHRGKYPDKYTHTYFYLKHILTSYFTLVKVYLAFYLTSIFPHCF